MNKLSILAVCTTMSLLATSCVDDNYNISDIDTTTRVRVNSLTIPINLDEISLKNIVNLDDDDEVVKVINGEYVIVKHGEITTDNLSVKKFYAAKPSIPSSHTVIDIPQVPLTVPGMTTPIELEIPISSTPTSFKFEADDVSEYIANIESCKADIELDLNFVFSGIGDYVKSYEIRDLQLQFPKGLEMSKTAGGSYDMATGILSLPVLRSQDYPNPMNFTVRVAASGINFKEFLNNDYKVEDHVATISGEAGILEGNIVVNTDDLKPGVTELPESFTLTTNYEFYPFEVYSVTGTIDYQVPGQNIPEIAMTDIPKIFLQDGTDLKFVNPQIYMKIENPLTGYDLKAQSGISITAKRDNEADQTYSLDAPGYFTVSGSTPTSVFCLAPKAPKTTEEGFENPTFVSFSKLSDVLSGDGVPQQLKIDLEDTKIPSQHITDFMLGRDFGPINGSYRLVAPLDLKDGSVVYYTDVLDGWYTKDIEDLTIEALEITALVTADAPFSLDFTGYPIDVDHKQISDVEIVGASVPAYADNYELTIRITGQIRKLDGIKYSATAAVNGKETPLSENMSIKLTKVRPVVTGYYDKKL